MLSSLQLYRLFLFTLFMILLCMGCGKDSPGPTPDVTPPDPVTDLSIAASSDSSITLTWTATGDSGDKGTATVYDVRYDTLLVTSSLWDSATRVVDVPIPRSSGSPESCTVGNLSLGMRYCFALKAADEAGNWSQLSNSVCTTLGESDTIPPSAVSDLAVVSTTNSSVTLTWRAPGDDGNVGTAVAYALRYSISSIDIDSWPLATPAEEEVPAPQPAGSIEQCTVDSLSKETTYYFCLRVCDDEDNWSGLSNVVEATPGQIDTIPPASVTIDAISVTDSSVSLRWLAPGDDGDDGKASEYDLRYSNSHFTESTWAFAMRAEGTPLPKRAGDDERVTVQGLEPDTTYCFALRAADEAGNWSSMSNVLCVVTVNAGDSIPPGRISDLAIWEVTRSSVQLFWTAPGDDGYVGRASQYDIRYSLTHITASGWATCLQMEGEPLPLPEGTVQGFLVDGLEQGVTYYFAMKTADEVPHWSPMSNVVSTDTDTASVYFVNWDGTGDFVTIQEALDVATDHDTVRVAPGTYIGPRNKNLDYGGKDLVVISVSGPEVTIIDCEGDGRGIRSMHEGPDAVFSGFTITNGDVTNNNSGDDDGGGILCHSWMTIRNCIISGCRASDGGGVRLGGEVPRLENCVIRDNVAEVCGGGVYASSGSSVITGCTISSNESWSDGGGMYLQHHSAAISSCVILDNQAEYEYGGGIYLKYASPPITDCVIASNSVLYDGVGGALYCGEAASPELKNCTLVLNHASGCAGIRFASVTSEPTLRNCIIAFNSGGTAICSGEVISVLVCCNIFGNEGGDWTEGLESRYGIDGNISEDPLFCDVNNGDFHIQSNSPCAPDDECDLIGALGVGCGTLR